MNAGVDRAVRASGLSLVAGLVVLAFAGRCLAAPDPADAQEKAKREKQYQQLRREYVTASQKGDLVRAAKLAKEALEVAILLYPEKDYPDGHPQLAGSLNNLGVLLRAQGQHGEARRYYERALKMYERLYPELFYPTGHPQLAGSLNNLGTLLQAQGEHGEARRYYERALKMRERLYAEKDHPNGHPQLAGSLNNLGTLLWAQGERDEARRYYERALKMYERLYPAGHHDLAASLNNLGVLLRAEGEYGEARRYFERALKMQERLYPEKDYPNGHPPLAISLDNVGGLFQRQGEYGEARRYCERALKMRERLYSEKDYPNGHPQLAHSLDNWGLLLQAQGEYGEALLSHFKALQMEQRIALSFLVASSEAEGLNFLGSQRDIRTVYLSCAARAHTAPDEAAYRLLYGGRGASLHMLRTRQAMLHTAADPDTNEKVRRLLDLRRGLSRLLLSPAGPARSGQPTAADLTRQKENLERELLDRLPPLARERATAQSRPNDLAKHLLAQSAFIDLYRFRDVEPTKGKWGQPGYFAFILAPDGTPRTVGPLEGKPIEEALARWQRDINAGLNSEAAEQLRRLLWEPLEKELPRGTTTVYLCPDGPLNALPWAALPGRDKGGVLLEDYALAVVPGGPFLLDQLQNPLKQSRPGALLAVGGVAYDDAPVPLKQAAGLRPTRGPATGPKKLTWPALEGTGKELDQVLALAKAAKEPPELLERRGAVAGTDRLLLDLPQARWTHLATHGFFAAPETEERKTLFREPLFAFGRGGERVGAGARNPLVQTGLVLAGANKAERKSLEDDPGILTGEAIAGLDLARMELAVLSACDTGLGEDTREAVLGLPRAFHLGGTRNVVASLWKVDDEATAALMALFYRNLWHKGQPPIEALRNAQLMLMRNPQDIPALAKERGPNFDKTVKRVETTAESRAPKPKGVAPVKQWAAFILSGPGR
jgi:CHAT domain-containing protein/Tfp pilus assembly protein PilF